MIGCWRLTLSSAAKPASAKFGTGLGHVTAGHVTAVLVRVSQVEVDLIQDYYCLQCPRFCIVLSFRYTVRSCMSQDDRKPQTTYASGGLAWSARQAATDNSRFFH